MKHLLTLALFLSAMPFSQAEITITPLIPCLCEGQPQQAFEVQADGSAGPFIFSWAGPEGYTSDEQNPADMEVAGVYTLYITNAVGCTFEYRQEPIPACEGPQFEFQAIPPAPCFGDDGQINLTLSGGQAPFQVAWYAGQQATGQSGLAYLGASEGVYHVLATDANGCAFTSPDIELEMPPPLSLQSSAVASCPGASEGSLSLSITGGEPPYEISWSNGATGTALSGLAPGDYTVTVSDETSCQETTALTVPALPEPAALSLVSLTQASGVGCNGSIEILAVGPGGPFTLEVTALSNNALAYQSADVFGNLQIPDLCPDDYLISATNAAGCTSHFQQEIISCAEITFTLNGVCPKIFQPTSCLSSDGAIRFLGGCGPDGGVGPYSYAWSNGENSMNNSNLPSGVYTLTVTDARGCQSAFNYNIASQGEPTIITDAHYNTCAGMDNGYLYIVADYGPGETFDFSWSSGQVVSGNYESELSGLAAGEYCVTVTRQSDPTCPAIRCYTIEEQVAQAPLQINGTTKMACPELPTGAIYTYVSGGVAPYTFSWDNGGHYGATWANLSAGMYCLTVTDQCGQAATNCFDVEVDPSSIFELQTTGISHASTAGSDDGAISVTAIPNGDYSYSWSNNEHGNTISGLAPGQYSVSVYSGSGCRIVRDYSIGDCEEEDMFPDFEIIASGGLFLDVGQSSTTVVAAIREEGSPYFTENISGQYSIRWEWPSGALIGNSSSLQIEQSDIPANSQFFSSGFENIRLTISNGCTEKSIYHFLIACGTEVNNDVVGAFFVNEAASINPCRDFQDGSVSLEIPNPNLNEVTVFRDGIELPISGSGELLLIEETGLGAGTYNYEVNIGACSFSFSYSLEEQASSLAFMEYDESSNACLYNESCGGQDLGQFQTPPYLDVGNPSSIFCAVPVNCNDYPNDVHVGWRTASLRIVRAAEYFRILELVGTDSNSPYLHFPEYIELLLEEARHRFDNCDKVRYCPASLKWVSDPITNSTVSDISAVSEDNCTQFTCQAPFWTFDFTVCDHDLDFPQDLFNAPLDFEGNTCMPVSANLFELYLAWKNESLDFHQQIEGTMLAAELAELDNMVPEDLNKARCATISYCNRDLNHIISNNFDNVECGYFIITGDYNSRFYDLAFDYDPIPLCVPVPHYDPLTEVITHETVNCRVGDGFQTKIILYDFEPTPPQLISSPNAFITKKFVIDTFFVEKLSNFALHIDEGQRAPKGLLDTDYGKDLYLDFSNKAPSILKNKIPNIAFHIDDWDQEISLFCTILADMQEYEIVMIDSIPRWSGSLHSDNELKIEHFSKTEDEIIVAGYSTGQLEFGGVAIANSIKRMGFIILIGMNGDLLNIYTLGNLYPNTSISFSENENGAIYVASKYKDGLIDFNGNPISMARDSGIYVGKFVFPGQFLVVADIGSTRPMQIDKITQSQALGEFTLGLSCFGENQLMVYDANSQAAVHLGHEKNLLLATFDENDQFAWHRVIDAQNIDLAHFDIANGDQGDVFLGLTYSNSILNDFVTSAGENDIAVLKLDGYGNIEWQRVFGSIENENVSRLMYDNGILFFGGEFSGASTRVIGTHEFINATPFDSSRAYITLLYDEGEPTTSFIAANGNEDGSILLEEKSLYKPTNIRITDVFPNPFNDEINIRMHCKFREPLFVELYNLFGERVFYGQENVDIGKNNIQIIPEKPISEGIYYLKLFSLSCPEGAISKVVKINKG